MKVRREAREVEAGRGVSGVKAKRGVKEARAGTGVEEAGVGSGVKEIRIGVREAGVENGVREAEARIGVRGVEAGIGVREVEVRIEEAEAGAKIEENGEEVTEVPVQLKQRLVTCLFFLRWLFFSSLFFGSIYSLLFVSHFFQSTHPHFMAVDGLRGGGGVSCRHWAVTPDIHLASLSETCIQP